ncbi:efflux RND transporter periplasmic adaptor subunit [Grimontia sp. AD028]|uniref:efflux RND transporter periplasmic adaptor subunit n=1 Tax=Grimontia sp. AD028 TaxID=1581149 RepID=UPI000695EA8A|nr:efflux RND transporter periplasmic adaptor subunit [Grimontia sp. AD028]
MKMNKNLLLASLLFPGLALAQGVQVDAMTTEHAQFTPTQSYVAKLEAAEHAKLMTRISGYLMKQHFSDGAWVNEGDVLFEIDPVPYQQALAIAEANLEKAKAALARVELSHKRVKALQDNGGATQSNLDDSTAELTVSLANVAVAEAAANKARDDLSYTKIRAPYDGRLGRSNFSRGDMITPASGPITDIVKIHPITATFSVSHDEYQQQKAKHQGPVSFLLEETGQQGGLKFVDNKINPASGTIKVAAKFDNEDLALFPNQVVRVSLNNASSFDGVWIPQASVQQALTEQFVYVVNDGKAERRAIEVLERQGTNVFVSNGIEAGERVITAGLLRVRPDVPVVVSEE